MVTITWNKNDYSYVPASKKDGYGKAEGFAPCTLESISNTTLDTFDLFLHVVCNFLEDEKNGVENIHEDYDIKVSTDNIGIGQITAHTQYKQKTSDSFYTQIHSIHGKTSSTGIFKDFHDGNATIEFDQVSGERRLTLFKK